MAASLDAGAAVDRLVVTNIEAVAADKTTRPTDATLAKRRDGNISYPPDQLILPLCADIGAFPMK
jgi:hypothetical protein